jgi:hypothetical protein
MATTLFDLILPEVATARVRTLPDEANYTLKQFMPERNINVIKAQLRIGVRNIKPAIYRSVRRGNAGRRAPRQPPAVGLHAPPARRQDQAR